jgi:G3E family GTPase
MKIHLVGGFLGSGKTTAIGAAARLLQSKGITVGVVTNDLGRSLVDTKFVQAGGIAAFEVTGGCFCCNLPKLETMITRIESLSAPAVIFAEPVGSCADLIATVLKPLIASGRAGREMGRLSVFTDARLLRQRLRGGALPFGVDVQYIYDCQIEEAEILVLNKSDLLPPDAAWEAVETARARFPEKTILLQSSFDQADIQRWTEVLNRKTEGLGHRAIPVDYDRYSHGETGLAWYDATLSIDLSEDRGNDTAHRLVVELRDAVRRRGRPVGHLKVHLGHPGGSLKVSITDDLVSPSEMQKVCGRHLDVVINARTEDSAEGLQAAIREGTQRALSGAGIAWAISNEESFHPARPQPYLRMP